MRLLVIGAACLGLVGCSMWESHRLARDRAEILAMYKACLQRKEADPRLDCSEYRRAWIITSGPN